jgi:hypothetical protein
MRLKQHSVTVILVLIFFTICFSPVSAQDKELFFLLDKITERFDSYPQNRSWKAMSIIKECEMNKQWQPEKTTIVKSIMKVADNESNNEILEAVETENGKTTDITKKVIEQDREQEEKAKKQPVKRRDKNETTMGFSLTELLPFAKEMRSKYSFRKLEDTAIEGNPVYVIEAKAKEKDVKLFEGKYYIDQSTYDVLKIHVNLSKNPIFVDEMDMEMNFKVLPEGIFVLKNFRTRASGGMLMMHIRMLIEQEFSDYEILPAVVKQQP